MAENMKTIRHNVFETNSSSCHSITINHDSVTQDQNNYVIDLYADGEYGWDYHIIRNPDELLDYATIAFAYIVDTKDEFDENINNVINYFETRGVTINKKFEYGTGYWGTTDGYIDHQSGPIENDECHEVAMMFYEPEKLYNFVFGGSTVETDNDNH